MDIEINRDLPPPPPTEGRPRKYPFPDMAVGDSFTMPLSGANTLRGEDHTAHRLRSSAMRYARLHGGKFTVRTDREADVARCWRTE